MGRTKADAGRRVFLKRGLAAAGGTALVGAAGLEARQASPAIVTPETARPSTAFGAAIGDVTGDRALIWSRTDRPARMVVEWATTESFRESHRVVGPAALENTDFTARMDLGNLPRGQRVVYRVLFQDLTDLRTWSRPIEGRFQVAPEGARDVSFAFSADTVGQGFGINADWGGLNAYETVRKAAPDFFIHSGDAIYADQPLLPEVKLDDGSVWKNVMTPAKAKVAETLAEFRGNYLYNLLDDHLRRFNAEVPVVAQWDDHETHNNWYPTQLLEDPRYEIKSVALLSARAKRAFLEYSPLRLDPRDPERIHRVVHYGPLLDVFVLDMRSHRGPNSPNRQTARGEEAALLGAAQVEWLKSSLAASRASWKVVASDMPIGLVVPDGPVDLEAVANGDPGVPFGRELEIADLLAFLKRNTVRNVVWVTADVHYSAAHHYDPGRARFTDFLPFWEFVAGPIHAGTFGPSALDPTFGPEVKFLGIPPGMKPNRPPSEGFQFFGLARIDGRSRVMTVRLHDLSGRTLYSVELPPEGGVA
jgi:alkaline phosphatase D